MPEGNITFLIGYVFEFKFNSILAANGKAICAKLSQCHIIDCLCCHQLAQQKKWNRDAHLNQSLFFRYVNTKGTEYKRVVSQRDSKWREIPLALMYLPI